MALWKFSNLNKYGTLRSRIIYYPDGKPFSYNPKGLGWFVAARRFKYTHEHMYPPAIFQSNGKTYIVPGWQEVLPETTLNDVEWIKPEVKKVEPEKNEWMFESSSDPGHFYRVRQTGTKFTCNCPGVWRSKDRRCKHIKEVESTTK
jgi:hypothetical protein